MAGLIEKMLVQAWRDLRETSKCCWQERGLSACAIHMSAEKVRTPTSSCWFPGGKIAGDRGEKPLVIMSLYREYKEVLWVSGNKNCPLEVMGTFMSMRGKYRLPRTLFLAA